MQRILLAQSFVLLRPVLEKILRDADFEVHTVTTSRETIAAVCDSEYDLLLIDVDMTLCGGLNTVRYIRGLQAGRDLRVLGLTTRCERDFIITSLKSGVTTLLLKEHCTAESLVERVRQLLAAPAHPSLQLSPPAMGAAASEPHPARPIPAAVAVAHVAAAASTQAAPILIIRPEDTSLPAILAEPPKPLTLGAIDGIIPHMLQGKALRPIVQKVISMAGNPEVTAADVAVVLRHDMELSAKVVAAANSAFYRRRNVMVRNVTDAINVIGLNGTRTLAMSLGVVDHFRADSRDPLLAMPGLWGHSVSVAHIAEALAHATQVCDAEQAFMVGLLHDLGRMLMAEHMPNHYRHVVHAPVSTPLPLHELERKIVGIDHALIGAMVTERWGCPTFISKGVKLHHSHSIQTEDGEDPLGGMARLVMLAEAIAIAFGFPGDPLEELPILPRGWLGKMLPNPIPFRDSVLDSLREAQAMIMCRSSLTIDMPEPWRGDWQQILVMGAVVQPLEPAQLLISHAYHDANLVSAARVDRGIDKTLVLADLRGTTKAQDGAQMLNWLTREKAPLSWPVLLMSNFKQREIAELGLGGRRVACISPPLRPVLIRPAAEALAFEQAALPPAAAA